MIPERRIRTLRLVAPEESWIGRGAFLVEDALRTASLPWADAGRLLLVRTVDLGMIPAGAAPASVALALESRLRELTPTALHAAHPAAPRAAAVWFRDIAEAHALLAAKLARSEETAAWFWPLAVPAWTPGTPPSPALRALLLGALETPAGPAAALELMRALQEAGGLDLLAFALAPADGPRLLRACGWRMPEATGAALPAVRGAGALALARWAEAWGRGDARTVWLGAVLRGVERNAAGGPASAMASGRPELSRLPALGPHPPAPSPIAPPPTGRGGEPSPPAPLPQAGEGRTAKASILGKGRGFPPLPVEGNRPAAGRGGEGGQGGEVHGAPEPTAARSNLLETPSRAVHPSPARGRGAGGEGSREGVREKAQVPEKDLDLDLSPPPALEDRAAAAFSPHAGLFFLLPVLARLGLATFLDENPHFLESNFPARLLDLVARRLGADPDDPVRRALPVPDDAEDEMEESLQILLTTWLNAVRRWCRRRAGIGLADLVRRPGLVIATRTHVDVYFDPHSVEIRVRRAGLDLDPGWVPWLGRVVLFHYEQPPEVVDVG